MRPADLDADRDMMVETFRRYLNSAYDQARFDWLYNANPYGRARAWIAEEKGTNTIVGVASAFPRVFYVEDKEIKGWILGDFCITDTHRSLGPALQLQRVCLRESVNDGAAFCYDFPSQQMLAVYRRLGIASFGQMIRLVKPLRIDKKVKEFVKIPVVDQGLSFIGNSLLALADFRHSSNDPLSIGFHEGPCGDEFSGLAVRIGSQHGSAMKRTADYLNWRYRDCPLANYELLAVRKEGRLEAYALFLQRAETGILVDLFGTNVSYIRELLTVLITLLRKRGIGGVDVSLSDTHIYLPVLLKLGFIRREISPFIVRTDSSMVRLKNLNEGRAWLFMAGDRDC